MFEMFTISDATFFLRLNKLSLVLFLSARVKLSHKEDYYTPSSALHIRKFAVGTCRGYLSRKFAAEICRIYLPLVFCVYKQITFVYVRKSWAKKQ